ncbi:MAG: dTDP-4-dehydrorhamnose reductase [Alphaproteobacteria bacterium]|nr:dTDP-4-dehydrorhamnose reductase [Alphaproteobacteria bacterium]
MNERPILLLGVTGQVGHELRILLARWREVLCPPSTVVNLLWPDEIRTYIRVSRPSLIVNAAAYTAVDAAEDNEEEAAVLNADVPLLLAEECAQRGIGLIHFSTDYVFSGRGGSGAISSGRGRQAYRETDLPDPINVYGRTKLRGESWVQQSGAAHLIFRCCWIYSAMGRNFLRTMQRLARERGPLNVVDDQIGSPTWARAIARAADEAIRQLRAAEGIEGLAQLGGIYHLAAAGETSWFGFAQAIMDRLNLWEKQWPADQPRPSVHPIATRDYPTKALRPAHSVLETAALTKTFGITLASWQEQLDACLGAG